MISRACDNRYALRPESSFRTIATLTLLPVAGLLVFFAWRLLHTAVTTEPGGGQAVLPVQTPPTSAVTEAATLPQKPKPTGHIVLIIDDVGHDNQQIERAMKLDPNINFAVLPNGIRGAEYARRLYENGFEVLCHLPMEPVGNASPGPNAVLTSMSEDEIEALTSANIRAVPFARGVNNHMGSRATADPRVMRSVLRALPRGMYFIDSRTGGDSVATAMARQMNIRTASRHVFLDDVPDEAAVRRQIAVLAAEAQKRGVAVGIGHPHRATLNALALEVPRLRSAGFRFVRASEAVE
ncbi:MAG TPA: divergent polysaccharide deacetylase family protein [Thermoanaerobaculia bacterium]|nr:divergent polysaccharide deacetylase family protein [Thermoanaerobaculia bacterium]